MCRTLFGLRVLRRPAVVFKHSCCWNLERVTEKWDAWRLTERARQSPNVVSIIIDVAKKHLVLGSWDGEGAPLWEKQLIPLHFMPWCAVQGDCLGICIKMGENEGDHVLIAMYCDGYNLENIVGTMTAAKFS